MKQLILALFALTATAAPAKVLDLDTERTIYINGPIGGNSIDIANQIEAFALKPVPVYLVINSPGGEVTLGYLIINSMNVAKERGVTFKCYVPQMAASMAYQVFANCNERYALPGAYLLWHAVRLSAQITLTPNLTKQIYIELRMIERRMTAELLSAMNVDKKFFYYHYNVETLWTASQLLEHDPKFLNIVTDASGLLLNFQQFELRQSRFGSKGIGNRGYKFIYESPYTLNTISQP
jgi:ATP-dependent protease ClpP protease subunit